MKAQVENITPQKASHMLLGSEAYQRNVSRSSVYHLAKQMADGKWVLNGETIVISNNNQVIDGQHRLLAVIQSGVEVPMMVVRGVSQDAFSTIDTGKSRTPGNTLHIAGVKNAANVAGCLAFRWKYLKAKSRDGSLNMFERPTQSELVEYAEHNPDIVSDAVSWTAKIRRSIGGIAPSTLGGTYIVMREQYGKCTSDLFYELLSTGEGLESGNPVLTLRNKLTGSNIGSSDIKWQVKAAYLSMAIKKYLAGENMSLLRWTEGKDKFPFI